MKLIVAGSRDWKYKDIIFDYLDNLQKNAKIDEIVYGCARGVDTIGKEWAEQNNILVKEFPANWKIFGKSAGVIRNDEMAQYATHAIVFLVADLKNKGSNDMIQKMLHAKKFVKVITMAIVEITY